MARAIGDVELTIHAMATLSQVESALGDDAAAVATAQEAARLADRTRNLFAREQALQTLSLVLWTAGRDVESMEAIEQLVELLGGDEPGAMPASWGMATVNLAEGLLDLGRWDEAHTVLERALCRAGPPRLRLLGGRPTPRPPGPLARPAAAGPDRVAGASPAPHGRGHRRRRPARGPLHLHRHLRPCGPRGGGRDGPLGAGGRPDHDEPRVPLPPAERRRAQGGRPRERRRPGARRRRLGDVAHRAPPRRSRRRATTGTAPGRPPSGRTSRAGSDGTAPRTGHARWPPGGRWCARTSWGGRSCGPGSRRLRPGTPPKPAGPSPRH